MAQPPLLELEQLSKTFPGVRALDRVSLTVEAGQIHAVVGETGCGKSTLVNCLFGIHTRDAGRILLEGREVAFSGAAEARRHQVALVRQQPQQPLDCSVLDYLFLGRYPKKWGLLVDRRQMEREARALMEELGLSADLRQPLRALTMAQRQMAELARAVVGGVKVLVLDEPAAFLNSRQLRRLLEVLRTLRDRGVGILYVSSRLNEVRQLADTITVLRDGAVVSTRPAAEFPPEEIIRDMVETAARANLPEKTKAPGEPLLTVRNLSGLRSHLRDIGFTVRRGEILGLTGLEGSGRSELLKELFGLSERASGEIELDGRLCRNRSPREAIRNGFALLPEDRRSDAMFPERSILDNTVIASLSHYRTLGLLRTGKMRRAAQWSVEALRTKAPTQETRVRNLSGGNQQKVLLGRWILTEPQVLLLDEPIRGIDAGAQYDICQLLLSLAAQGKALIVASSEVSMLLRICDRILVMSEGRMAGLVEAARTSREELMALATKNL